MSLREKIKNVSDIKKEIVRVEAWDDIDIEIRTMSAKIRSDILGQVMDEKGKINHDKFHALMIIASCYEAGTDNLIFTDDDAEWLMNKAVGPIELIVSKVMKLSGLSKDAMDTAEKN